MTVLKPGATCWHELAHGGHLTHGNPLNFSGKMYRYDFLRRTEGHGDQLTTRKLERGPGDKSKLIRAGRQRYPRLWISSARSHAKQAGRLSWWTLRTLRGSSRQAPSQPLPPRDFVTTTPIDFARAGAAARSSAGTVCQGARQNRVPRHPRRPLIHVLPPSRRFRKRCSRSSPSIRSKVVLKSRTLAKALAALWLRIVSGGTGQSPGAGVCFSKKETGKQGRKALGKRPITVNKNVIPFDANPPVGRSGIRVGTPAVTTRRAPEPQMELIAHGSPRCLHNVRG